MPIGLVLADDHHLILDGLENLFRLEGDFQVLARCTSGEETLKTVRQHRPDILILDIRMPGMDGLAIAREIRSEGLPTRIVLLTAELDEDQLLEAVRLGVQGIVLKEMAPQLLVQCIRKVYSGEQWLEHNSTKLALEKMLKRAAGAREMASRLTAREIDLIRMIAKGLRNKEIADKLFISEGTVKVHLHHIYEKLGIDGRLALLRFAQDKNLD
jgi:DNA-binding NarL/FixJ family response regulator